MILNLILTAWSTLIQIKLLSKPMLTQTTNATLGNPIEIQIANILFIILSILLSASTLVIIRRYIDGQKEQHGVLWAGTTIFWKYIGLSIMLLLILIPGIIVLGAGAIMQNPLILIIGIIILIAYLLWFIFNYFFAQVEITSNGIFESLRNTRALWKANKKIVRKAVGGILSIYVISFLIIYFIILPLLGFILATSLGLLIGLYATMILTYILVFLLIIILTPTTTLFTFKVWKHVKSANTEVV